MLQPFSDNHDYRLSALSQHNLLQALAVAGLSSTPALGQPTAKLRSTC